MYKGAPFFKSKKGGTQCGIGLIDDSHHKKDTKKEKNKQIACVPFLGFGQKLDSRLVKSQSVKKIDRRV